MGDPTPLATLAMLPEIDGLLDGLDANDFDFDGLDDDCCADSSAAYPPPPTAPTRSPSPDTCVYEAPDPIPDVIPQFVSFGKANGGKIGPLSAGALKRARKIIEAAEADVEGITPPKRTKHSSPPPATPSAAAAPPAQESHNDSPACVDSPLSTPTSGFQLGTGEAAAPLDPRARSRVLAIFGEAPDESTTPASPVIGNPTVMLDRLSEARGTTSGYPLASEGGVPEISNAARASALALLGDESQPAGFAIASGSSAPPVDPQARACVLALFGESSPSPSRSQSTSEAARSSHPGPSTAGLPQAGPSTPGQLPPFRPSLDQSDTPTRLSSPAFTAPRRVYSAGMLPSTPSRTPLQSRTNTFARTVSTPVGATPGRTKLPAPIQLRTPAGATPRRIGLGSSTPGGGGKKGRGFATPFKAPGMATKVAAPSGLRAPVVPLPTPEKVVFESVFDLTPPAERLGMRESYLRPGFYSNGELAEMGFPDEIWTLDLTNAIYYQFIGEDASILGIKQALARLKFEKCHLATAKWVNNHWCQILWKLVGQVRAKPALFDVKWNWYEVLCQLKYRYEREFGCAQRPLVRRIQEHDSSSSLPMVLCVAGIHRPPPTLNDKDELVPQRPFLDLTDGWYKIRALLDDALGRAVLKGKIKVGRKLGISGAKLESGADGTEVLDAYEKSHLVLAGNSTHLAPWDARLGPQAQPFVAGMSSLTVDGGRIVLMDVVVDRVYPLGYVNKGQDSRDSAPWNEEEEHARADAWKETFEAESTRLQDEMRKSLEKIEDLAATLASHAEDVNGPISNDPPDSMDSDFDDLFDAEPKLLLSRLRALGPSQLVHLAQHAHARVNRAAEEERVQLEASLKESCPLRDVRNFRMVRIRDARRGRRDPARTALLNVWDAALLGDALVEGKRYLLSNVFPSRKGDWSRPKPPAVSEVYLTTRQETRWKPVEASTTPV